MNDTELRDEIALQALEALLPMIDAKAEAAGVQVPSLNIAAACYELADAMMNVRSMTPDEITALKNKPL